MAKQYICMSCELSFPSDISYQQHKDSNHATQGIPLRAAPTSEEATEANPNAPDQSLIDKHAAILEEQKNPTPPPKLELPPPAPILLTYKYTGVCPTCRREPVTLSLETESGLFMVAFCQADNKQLTSRKVEKL